MKSNSRLKRLRSIFGSGRGAALIFIAVLVFVCFSLNNAKNAISDEGLRTAEASIRRASITCFAIEGYYPPSYEYLYENYGVRVDTEKYVVHYEVFASNIMPDISVFRLESGSSTKSFMNGGGAE